MFLLAAASCWGQVCRVSVSGLNRNRRVIGPVHTECPLSLHTPPFGNWGVTSNFGQKRDDHQFQGWCHETQVCDNNGTCHKDCLDGWWEWNSCTDIAQYKAPNCTLYNDAGCTQQVTTTGVNIHGTRTVDLTVRCPTDTSGDGIADQGGCADLRTFSNGTNFMSLYELDPITGDDLVQTLYFPDNPVALNCDAWGCGPAQSDWVTPGFYDSPTSPAKVFAELATSVNSATFVDTSRSCRAQGPAVTTVSAASFAGPSVAPESIAAAFGRGLASGAVEATAPPLSTALGGTSITVTDSVGTSRPALLFYVSPDQVNYQVPAGTAPGPAQVLVSRTDNVTARGTVLVTPASPALFSKNANASGVAAATAERIQTGGARNNAPVYRCDTPSANCVPVPIDLGAETDEVYLSLYGTGIRQNGGLANVRLTLGGLPAEVLYAGPQTQFTGLDQINVRVPQSLRGRGVVDVVVSVGAMSSNVVTIAVQ
jgi:uncharacterized protein (TIGR03437 family)